MSASAPFFSNFIVTYFENYLLPSIFKYSGSVQIKIDRIPKAIELFINQPFTGYGSRGFVQKFLMDTDDIPSPFIYLLSGGIGLLILFLINYTYPLYWINSKLKYLYHKEIKVIY